MKTSDILSLMIRQKRVMRWPGIGFVARAQESEALQQIDVAAHRRRSRFNPLAGLATRFGPSFASSKTRIRCGERTDTMSLAFSKETVNSAARLSPVHARATNSNLAVLIFRRHHLPTSPRLPQPLHSPPIVVVLDSALDSKVAQDGHHLAHRDPGQFRRFP